MAGLMSKAAPAGKPNMAAGQEMMGAEEEGNVSPEEQAQYDTFVTNGMEVMYSKQVMPQLLESMGATENPAEGLANAVVFLVKRLEDSARKNNTEISGDVMFHGATELLEQVADLATEAGVHEYTEEEMESAVFMAMDMYREMATKAGTLPQEGLTQDMNELVEAEKKGRLDEVVPGASEYAQRKQSKGEPA